MIGKLAVVLAVASACSSADDPSDAGAGDAAPATAAPTTDASVTTTSSAPTTTSERPPELVPAGVRWTDGLTFDEVGGAGSPPRLIDLDGDLWMFGSRYNSVFAARSTDAGLTWSEVALTETPTSGAVRALDVVRGPDGRLVVVGRRDSQCMASLDLGNGFIETSICKRFRPVLFLSDDDGASWREVAPGAMAPPGDSSVIVENIIVTDAGYVAAGTVRGPDWHVRLWSSPDGESWSLDREIRGPSQYASAEQLVTDGETVALLVSEHPCGTPNDNTPGWILGSAWVRWPRLYTGSAPGDLELVAADAHPLLRDLELGDCDELGSLARIAEIDVEYPQPTAAVIGGTITLLEDPRPTDADVAADESDDDEAELTSGLRRLSQLIDGQWTLVEIDGVQSAVRAGTPFLIDVDGVPGVVETRFAGSPLTTLVPILPDGDGSWVQRQSERPVIAREAVGAAWVDGTLVVAGRSLRDPFLNILGPENPEQFIVWTSVETSGPAHQTCELGPNAQCRFADLTSVDGYPDFGGMDLSGADLSFARFGDADFSGSDFTGARLWRVVAFAPSTVREADFTGAQLQDARLNDAVGADFTFSNLRGANLDDVTGATLAGASLDRATLSFDELPALDGVDPTGVRLEPIAPGGDAPYEISLAGLNLTDVTVRGETDGPLLVVLSLDGSIIDNTTFMNTDLTRLDVATIDLSGAKVWDDSLCPDGLPPDDPPIGTCVRGLVDD